MKIKTREFKISLPVKYDDLSWQKKKMVREEYTKIQGGKCHFCKTDLSGKPESEISKTFINELLFPENFFKFPVHLHHCRKTGLTIGALHNRCNAFLWQYHGE